MLNYVKLIKTIFSFCSKLNNGNKDKFTLQMITVLFFLTLKTKLRIKINA